MYFKNQEEVCSSRFKELGINIIDLCLFSGIPEVSLYRSFKLKSPRIYTYLYLNDIVSSYLKSLGTKEIVYFKKLQEDSISYSRLKKTKSKRQSLYLMGFSVEEIERIIT